MEVVLAVRCTQQQQQPHDPIPTPNSPSGQSQVNHRVLPDPNTDQLWYTHTVFSKLKTKNWPDYASVQRKTLEFLDAALLAAGGAGASFVRKRLPRIVRALERLTSDEQLTIQSAVQSRVDKKDMRAWYRRVWGRKEDGDAVDGEDDEEDNDNGNDARGNSSSASGKATKMTRVKPKTSTSLLQRKPSQRRLGQLAKLPDRQAQEYYCFVEMLMHRSEAEILGHFCVFDHTHIHMS
jgi:hypothetical protein